MRIIGQATIDNAMCEIDDGKILRMTVASTRSIPSKRGADLDITCLRSSESEGVITMARLFNERAIVWNKDLALAKQVNPSLIPVTIRLDSHRLLGGDTGRAQTDAP
jgi:hypothetical protein